MSLYVHQENQKMLWNAINSSPIFKEFNIYPKPKEIWFKEIIELFYRNIKGQITVEELKIINRDTIAYMVNQMKINIARTKEPIGTDVYTNEHTDNHTDVNFLDEKDKPISNMDELIEQHIKQRNDELQKIMISLPNVFENGASETDIKIVDKPIKSSLKKTSVYSDNDVSLNLNDINDIKKTVSFFKEDVDSNEIKKELNELKSELANYKTILYELKQEVAEISNTMKCDK
jgi:hypothetical protein